MVDDTPWCFACQSPHSPEYCVVAQFISAKDATHEEEEETFEGDNVDCLMISSCLGEEVYSSDIETQDFDIDNHRQINGTYP